MPLTHVDNYAAIMSQRIAAARVELSSRWLARLNALLPVGANEVFLSTQLLDHIPALIAEIAAYLRAPAEEEIAANTSVMDKARELGLLRHAQKASVHQLLREYELLGDLVESFVIDETERLTRQPLPDECFDVLRRLTRAVRILARTTVDTFVSEYTTTIEEANERIRTFNQMASHEMRNPIGTLVFAAAALGNDAVRLDPIRHANVAATIRTNAERLSRLVDNLQRLAKLGDQLDVPSEQRVELRAIALEVARQLAESAALRRTEVRVAENLPTVYVDPARLELVLVNLVSNAIKYSDPQKPDSWVEISAAGPSGDQGCVIAIADNGIGIPDTDQESIFERFFRAHSHLDVEHGVSGSGLGLAIVLECVRTLGGSVRCESSVGQGATFFVTLPREEPADHRES
jgi:two-component system, OmpR family, sensor histidine kinase KdpD